MFMCLYINKHMHMFINVYARVCVYSFCMHVRACVCTYTQQHTARFSFAYASSSHTQTYKYMHINTGAGGAPVLNLSFADMRAARTFPVAGSGARSDASAASTIPATPVAAGASDRVEGGVGSAASPAAPAQPSATLLPDVAALEPAAAPEELLAPTAASTQDSSASIVVDTEISAEAAAEAQAEADAQEQEDIATGSDSQEQLDTLAAMARLSEAANAPPLVLPAGTIDVALPSPLPLSPFLSFAHTLYCSLSLSLSLCLSFH